MKEELVEAWTRVNGEWKVLGNMGALLRSTQSQAYCNVTQMH